ncbi:MAG TPA: GAF domain-containing sensor histidine kinase [Capillimicrobium sp.]|nr:GAF domain-containing sensor histidine kinase [Capillimicrobium sp.]
MLDEPRLRRVLEVGRTVVSELDLETVLQRVLNEARDLTGARYAALGILDDQRRELERFLTVGIGREQHATIGDLPRGRGVLGVLIEDPRPLRLADVGHHARSYGFPLGHPPMRSFLGVPVLVRGQAFGNLYLTDKEGAEEFDEADEEAIVLLAGWAGIAIDNARAYLGEQARRSELEQAVRALEATTDIARAVGGETNLDRVLELIVKRARALVDARSVLILLEDGDELEVAAVAGRASTDLLGERIPTQDSVSGHVLRTRRPERLINVGDRLRHALAGRIDARTGLFVPLLYRGRAVGVLSAYDRGDGEDFLPEHERMLEGFAASAATAVATAQSVQAEGLRRSIEASERERQRWARELHDETLQEMAGLKVLLSGARRRVDDAEAVRGALDAALAQLDSGITALRRLITDLRPAALDEFGVATALEGLVERVAAQWDLEIELDVELGPEDGRPGERFEAAIEDALYRIVQEALTNVVKHAHARHVEITVREERGQVELMVADDGVGFDADAPTDGFGIVGMRERVALASGTWSVARRPQGGTVVRASIPVSRRAAIVQAAAG